MPRTRPMASGTPPWRSAASGPLGGMATGGGSPTRPRGQAHLQAKVAAPASGQDARSGLGADPCLLLAKGLLGKFMRARMRDLLAPLVSYSGDDVVRVKGLVASQVVFLDIRSRAAVERAIARHRSKPLRVRFENGAEAAELVLDFAPPPQGGEDGVASLAIEADVPRRWRRFGCRPGSGATEQRLGIDRHVDCLRAPRIASAGVVGGGQG